MLNNVQNFIFKSPSRFKEIALSARELFFDSPGMSGTFGQDRPHMTQGRHGSAVISKMCIFIGVGIHKKR